MSHRPIQFLASLTIMIVTCACTSPEDAYTEAERDGSLGAYVKFIERFDDDMLVGNAVAAIEEINASAEPNSDEIERLEGYLSDTPESKYYDRLFVVLDDLQFKTAQASNSIVGFETYLNEFPTGRNRRMAGLLVADLQKPASYAEQTALFEIPAGVEVFHSRVNKAGSGLALLGRSAESIFLMVSGFPVKEYRGYVGYQYSGDRVLGKHYRRPQGASDVLSVGGDTEEHEWLAWSVDENLDSNLVLSENGEQVAFIVHTQGKQRIVVNLEAQPLYDYVSPAVFSADGSFAYLARIGEEYIVIVDGKSVQKYPRVVVDSLHFSPTGKLFFVVEDAEQYFAVWDSSEGPRFDFLMPEPVFSPDGSRLAYFAERGDEWHVVLDGELSAPYDNLRVSAQFSDDGSRFAFAAEVEESWRYVIDGSDDPAFDAIDSFEFSERGRSYAYRAKQGDQFKIIHNGEALAVSEYPLISPTISEDESQVAYSMVRDGQTIIYMGSERQSAHDGDPIVKVLFASDGSFFTLIKHDQKTRVIVNGEEGAAYEGVTRPVFDRYGNPVYAALRDGNLSILIDGNEERSYVKILTNPALNQYDDRAFVVWDGQKSSVELNDEVIERFDQIFLGSKTLTFAEDGSFSYLARRDNIVVRTHVMP